MTYYDDFFQQLVSALTVVKGNIELIRLQNPEDMKLNTISQGADKATKALAMLRDYHGLITGNLKPLDVLVVDDEPEVGGVFVDAINQYGNNAVFANGGREGIAKFRERSQDAKPAQKPYDLVLTDLLMPEVDGYDVVSAVKNGSPTTRVVVVSATPSDWERIASGRASLKPDGLLPKPIPLTEIYFQLAQARQRRY